MGLMEAPIMTYISEISWVTITSFIKQIFISFEIWEKWFQWTQYTRNSNGNNNYSSWFWHCGNILFGESNVVAECSINLCLNTDTVHYSNFICKSFSSFSSSWVFLFILFLYRFLRRQFGCYQKTDQLMLTKAYNGCADGLQPMLYKPNLMICNDPKSTLNGAIIVKNNMKYVIIRYRQSVIKFVISFGDARFVPSS